MDRLDNLLNAKSIALIGASRDEKSVGYGILMNLTQGCAEKFYCNYSKPFQGSVFAVNPKADEILGKKCYKSILEINEEIDLGIIAVPAPAVISIVKDCIKKKVRALIVISSGFAEYNEEGKKMQKEISEIVKKAGIPLVGPNCLGILNPLNNMNASFAPGIPPAGGITFISQSGALADSIIDWSIEERYGFRAIVTYGNKADVDETDFLEYFGQDKDTKAIALYVEGINNGRKFMEVAKKVSKKKPVIILKSGRTEKGMHAVSSHTGSLAGSYEVYKAAFKQSGIIIADTVEELFDIAITLSNQPACGKNVGIITNAGGPGVLCADYCETIGLNVVGIKESTLQKLEKTGLMHPAYSRANPLDIVGDALPERYEAAINTLMAEPYIDGIIVIQTLQTMTDPLKDAEIVVAARKKFPDKPVLCVYMGGKFSKEGVRILKENGVPDFNDLKKAVSAMKFLSERKEWIDKK